MPHQVRYEALAALGGWLLLHERGWRPTLREQLVQLLECGAAELGALDVDDGARQRFHLVPEAEAGEGGGVA